jgi:hypothetical protein
VSFNLPANAGFAISIKGSDMGEGSKAQDRRAMFRKVGLLGAGVLTLVGLSKPAQADVGGEGRNPLLGLWDMTIPGSPVLYFTFAISEGAYVCTGNYDSNSSVFGFTFGPTMGTYVQVGARSYRIRQKAWPFDPAGNPAGAAYFTGTANVSTDGKSFSGAGIVTQYDLNGAQLFAQEITYTALKNFA